MRRQIIAFVTIAFIALVFGIVVSPATGLYDMTVRIVSSTGTVLNGTASAVTALYDKTVRVVNSNNQVIDSFSGGVPGIQLSSYATCDGKVTFDAAMPAVSNWTGASNVAGIIVDYRGVNTSTPVDTSGSAVSTTSTIVAPSVTTTIANDLLVTAFGMRFAPTVITPPGDETQRAHITGASANQDDAWMGDKALGAAGATTTETATYTGASFAEIGISIALEPAIGKSISVIGTYSWPVVNSNLPTMPLADPAGAQTGDVELACITTNSAISTTSAGWSLVISNNTSGTITSCYVRTVTQANNSTVLTSATAGFTSADAGKLVCVECAGGTVASTLDKQCSPHATSQCGTILSNIDATHDYLGFGNINVNAVSAAEMKFGTNNATGIANAITALSNQGGGVLYLPQGRCATNAQITLPANVQKSIDIEGTGATASLLPLDGGIFTTSVFAGSTLDFLTESMTAGQAGIRQAGSYLTTYNAHTVMRNFSVEGSVGIDYLGGGSGVSGINLSGNNNTVMENLSVVNWGTNGVLIDAIGITHLDESTVNGSGAANVVCGNTECMIVNNDLSFSNTYGLQITGGASPGLNVYIVGNVLQDEGLAGIQTTATGSNQSGLIASNFCNINGPCVVGSQWLAGMDIVANFHGTGSTGAPITFSAAGTPLPTCVGTLINEAPSCVSDALGGCFNGSVYVSGGTSGCAVVCNGTNWIETGAGCNGVTTLAPLRGIHAGSSTAVVSNTVASFFPLDGASAFQPVATFGDASAIFPVVTAKNLQCALYTAAGALTVAGGTNYVMALAKNGAASALTCTIAAAASSCTDVAHTVTTVALDQLQFMDTPTGTPTALVPKCSVEIDY